MGETAEQEPLEVLHKHEKIDKEHVDYLSFVEPKYLELEEKKTAIAKSNLGEEEKLKKIRELEKEFHQQTELHSETAPIVIDSIKRWTQKKEIN